MDLKRLNVGGFKYVLSSRSRLEFWFWSAVVTAGSVFVGYILVETVRELVMNPYHTELRDDYPIQV